MNTELDKKLAEWAFDRVEHVCEPDEEHQLGIIFAWKGEQHVACELFTLSETACFKWLVPKLFTWSIGKNWELQKDLTIKENGIKASIDLHYVDPDKYDQIKPSEAIAETPALALCRAIEKLIDGV